MDWETAIRDTRFRDIGDLPTGFRLYSFKELMLRPFSLNELYIIAAGHQVDSIRHVIRAAQIVTSCDVNQLTDGDFAYVLAWLRMNSYPASPINAVWNCRSKSLLDHKRRKLNMSKAAGKSAAEIDRLGWTLKECGHENVYLSHGASMDIVVLEEDTLDDGLDYPRIGTLVEAEDLREEPEFVHIVDALRWIKEGTTLRDKYEHVKQLGNLDLFNKAKAMADGRITHGVTETVPIECMMCSTKQTIFDKVPSFIRFFAAYTETSLYNIQYNLTTAFNIFIEDNMPSQKLLYMHSSYVKDLNEKKERDALKAATQRKGKR